MSGLLPDDPDILPPAELIRKCEQLYTSFNAGTMTADAHADEAIAGWKIASSEDATFLKQVFYGLNRYKKMISVFVSAFYHHNSGTVLRSDVHMYTVFTYLTIMRLRELTFFPYRRLVMSQDSQKMLVFLAYMFNAENLQSQCRDEWMKLYDLQFVEQVISDILVWLPDVQELITKLEERVYLSKKKEEDEANAWAAAGTSKTTKVIPFNITERKPRVMAEEPEPPPAYIAKPAPPVKQGPTEEMKKIARLKEASRIEMSTKYLDPGPELKTQSRPSNLEKVKAQVEADFQAELRFEGTKARPAPAPSTQQVKLNAAAILREDALYKKKQEEEAKIIKTYEQELRDASTFTQWQTEMRGKDERERAEEIERRRLEMAAAQEAAIQAKIDKIAENHEMANEMKELGKQIIAEKQAEKQAQVDENRRMRDVVVADRAGVGQAHEKLAMEKKARAEQLMQEKQENARRLAEERAADQLRKQDIIRQLKAFENVPMAEVSEFDPSTTPGHGLLEEMSLIELKERLAVAKQRELDEQEERRAEILTEKSKRETLLQTKASNISRIRDMANAQAQARRAGAADAKQQTEAKAQAKREKDMLDLHERLQKKHEAYKQQQLKQAAEEKQIKFHQQQQAATKGQTEEVKFRGLRKGQERDLRSDQDTSLDNKRLYDSAKKRAETIRTHNIKVSAKNQRDFVKEYDARVAALTQEREQSDADDLGRKQGMVTQELTRVEGMYSKGMHMTGRAVTSQFEQTRAGMLNPDTTIAVTKPREVAGGKRLGTS